MSVRVLSWVWENSKSAGIDRLVLLAIADSASDDGGNAWPSIASLSRKAVVSTRTVQRSIRRLVEIGELAIRASAGRNGVNVYRVVMKSRPLSDSHPVTESPRQPDTDAESPRQNDTPSDSREPPGTVSPKPSLNRPTTSSLRSEAAAPAIPESKELRPTQRSKRITDAYSAIEPMCKWPAVNGVVLKAIKTGKWADDEIEAALLRLAKEGRGVTIESLRVELQGFTPGSKSATTTQKMNGWMTVGRDPEPPPERAEIGRSA